MTIYYGRPSNAGSGPQDVVRVGDDASVRALNPRRDLVDHAEGFAWGKQIANPGKTPDSGFLVNGASQLALAICVDALGSDQDAVKYHQRFKQRRLMQLVRNVTWQIDATEVVNIVANIKATEEDKGTLELRRIADQRPVEMEVGMVGGGAIVWDTDEAGRRITRRSDEG